MRKTVLAALAICTILALPNHVGAAGESYKNFEGHWRNENPQVGELIQLDITFSGTEVNVKAWGDCKPNPCDLGRTEAHIYADGRNSNFSTGTRALTVTYAQSFSVKTLVIEPQPPSQLRVSMFTHFTDRSGRTDYVEYALFRR